MSERYLSRAKFWKFAPEPYPNVCACIGTEIGVFHDRYWWHAAGPARQQFSLVEPEIVEQLNSVFTERYSSILLFHLYMIGRSRELAIPTIMFFCEQKEPRKKAKKAVDEGDLLRKLPGFRTGHLAKLPGLGKLIQPAAGCEDDQRSSEVALVSEVYFNSAHPVNAIGMPIFVKLPGNTLQKATANVVFDGEDYAYLSVSHIFSGDALSSSTTSDTDESEFDFGSGTEDGDENEYVDATSRASISSLGECSDSDSTSSAPSPMSYSEVIPLPDDHSFPNAASLEHLGNLIRYSLEMDWAVIDIQHPDVASAIHRLKDDVPHGNSKANTAVELERTNIVGHTSRGLITGRLSQEATYMRLPNSKTFQKVYQTMLDSALEMGDCGVMILDAFSQEPYGHIVVSSTMKEDAYIVSANEVFLKSGTRWEKSLEASYDSLDENTSYDAAIQTWSTNDHVPSPAGQSSTESFLRAADRVQLTQAQVESHSVQFESDRSLERTTAYANSTSSKGLISTQSTPPSSICTDFSWASTSASPYWQDIQPSSSSKRGLQSNSSDFRWITATKPSDFKAKSNMQTVRQTAMGSYLKATRNQNGRKGRRNFEFSDRSRSSNPADPIRVRTKKVPKRIRSSGPTTGDGSSIPHLPKRLIVMPIVSSTVYPFDVILPPATCLKTSLDPFQVTFRKHSSSVCVEKLMQEFSRYFMTYEMNKQWIPRCLQTPNAFLSTLYIASSLNDTLHNRDLEGLETLILLQELQYSIGSDLTKPETCAVDSNILAVLQIIIGHVMARKEASIVFYMSGLEAMIRERGGLEQVDALLASMISLVALEVAILDDRQPKATYLDYCAARQVITYAWTQPTPESPLHRPHGEYVTVVRSLQCNAQARQLLEDAYDVVNTLLDPMETLSNKRTTGLHNKISGYPPIEWWRHTKVLKIEDWRSEAIRICSVILSTAVMQSITLSSLSALIAPLAEHPLYTQFDTEPSRVPQDLSQGFIFRNSGFPFTHRSSSSSTTRSSRPSLSSSTTRYSRPSLSSFASSISTHLLKARDDRGGHLPLLSKLKEALENSNLSECWGDMAGVLLWIGLTAGTASRQCLDRPLQRYFSALAMRASLMLCFEHPEAMRTTLLRMTAVNEALGKASGDGKFIRNDAFVSRKRRKV